MCIVQVPSTAEACLVITVNLIVCSVCTLSYEHKSHYQSFPLTRKFLGTKIFADNSVIIYRVVENILSKQKIQAAD